MKKQILVSGGLCFNKYHLFIHLLKKRCNLLCLNNLFIKQLCHLRNFKVLPIFKYVNLNIVNFLA